MENFLQEIHDKITFKRWYLGHYHSDDNLSDKIRLVYNDIIEITSHGGIPKDMSKAEVLNV